MSFIDKYHRSIWSTSLTLVVMLLPASLPAFSQQEEALSIAVTSNNVWRGIPNGYGNSFQGEFSLLHPYKSFDKYHREGEFLLGAWAGNWGGPPSKGNEIDAFASWSPRISYDFWGEAGAAYYSLSNSSDRRNSSEVFVGLKFFRIEGTERHRLSTRFSTDFQGNQYLDGRFSWGFVRTHIGRWVAGKNSGQTDYSIGLTILFFRLDYTGSSNHLKERVTFSLNLGESRWRQ